MITARKWLRGARYVKDTLLRQAGEATERHQHTRVNLPRDSPRGPLFARAQTIFGAPRPRSGPQLLALRSNRAPSPSFRWLVPGDLHRSWIDTLGSFSFFCGCHWGCLGHLLGGQHLPQLVEALSRGLHFSSLLSIAHDRRRNSVLQWKPSGTSRTSKSYNSSDPRSAWEQGNTPGPVPSLRSSQGGRPLSNTSLTRRFLKLIEGSIPDCFFFHFMGKTIYLIFLFIY